MTGLSASGSIAIDTNLLVYAYDVASPWRGAAQAALTRAAHTRAWGIAVFSLGEFWSIVTRRGLAASTAPVAGARAFLFQLLGGGAQVWLPDEHFPVRLLAVAEELTTGGADIFGLQIALTVRERGATEIWTHDQRFPRLPGLAVVDPLAAP